MKSCFFACLCLALPLAARADEGMWLFNDPPRALLRDRYHFDPSDAWLDHLRLASVRFNPGGSGSFVSADGLLISNHHVGADALQKLSTSEKNYVRDGFYARTPAQEIKCLDLELNVLESIEDVTARVNAAVAKDADPAAAFAARRGIIADIEKQSQEQTGLRADVVTLWQGGAYHLYRYKRYTDVRLVFAPEQQAAFYGGDPDNFEFPRYDLDICLFRAYEDGQPARPSEWLRFSPEGPRDGDLVFVSGNPGRTSRLLTVAELKDLRDQSLPFRLLMLRDREVLLEAWSARGGENARRAKEAVFGVKNSRNSRRAWPANPNGRRRWPPTTGSRARRKSWETNPSNITSSRAPPRSTATPSASPAPSSAPPRNGPSPTAGVCANTPIPAAPPSNWPSSPPNPFTPTSNASPWPILSPFWRASWEPMTR